MKRLLSGAGLAALLLTACQTARTQGEPQVIVVPPDEMSRTPSLSPATSGGLPTPTPPPAAPSTPPTYATLTPAQTPAAAPAKHSYNSCNVEGMYIAMTFDDGPHATLTPKLLDMLKERNLKATFYVVGQNAAEYPDILKRMVAEGHEVANHSWNHAALNKLGAEGLRKQIEQTDAAIVQATGRKPTNMRPPYGATNAALNKKLDETYGLKVILWSVDPLDWKYRNSTRVANSLIQGAHPGAIMLAHDIHATTVAAMPQVFDALVAKGYKFVTVSELIAMDRPQQLVKKEPTAKPAPAPATAQ